MAALRKVASRSIPSVLVFFSVVRRSVIGRATGGTIDPLDMMNPDEDVWDGGLGAEEDGGILVANTPSSLFKWSR